MNMNTADPLAPQDGRTPTYEAAHILGPDGISFFTRVYRPSNDAKPTALVVFVHGFHEHVAKFEHVFLRMQDAGFSIAAFDQRGWGRTASNDDGSKRDGWFPWGTYGKARRPQQLSDVEWFVEWARNNVGKDVPVFVWGQSMGGGIALSYAIEKSPQKQNVAGIIATSTLLGSGLQGAADLQRISWLLAALIPWAPFPAQLSEEHFSKDPRVMPCAQLDPLRKKYATVGLLHDIIEAGSELVASKWRQWPKELPLLMAHETKDPICLYEPVRAFYDQVGAKDKHFMPYEGSFHEIHTEPDGVWEKYVDDVLGWMRKRVSSSILQP